MGKNYFSATPFFTPNRTCGSGVSLIEKLLTGVFGRRWSPFSKIIFLKMFGWIRKVLSQLDQRNLVCSNRINDNPSRSSILTLENVRF